MKGRGRYVALSRGRTTDQAKEHRRSNVRKASAVVEPISEGSDTEGKTAGTQRRRGGRLEAGYGEADCRAQIDRGWRVEDGDTGTSGEGVASDHESV